MISAIVWNVQPEIIEGFHVRWYGLLFALGFLGAYQVLQRILKHEGYSTEILDGITMAAFIGTIFGARLGHCLFYEPAYYLSHPIEILMVWKGGLASHGGTIGVLIAFLVYARKHKLDYFWILSRTAIVIPFTGACIRIGNLMNSEIYGHVTEMPWGFIFAKNGETLPMHPTQLYEALSYLLLFGVLTGYYWLTVKKLGKPGDNLIIGLFLTILFGSRILIEFVKQDQVEFEAGMLLNMGQILSIPFVLGGLYFIYRHVKLQR